MTTLFYTRVRPISNAGRDRCSIESPTIGNPVSVLLDDELNGSLLLSWLQQKCPFWPTQAPDGETAGDLCSTDSGVYCLREHKALLTFLDDQILDEAFDELDRGLRVYIRDFRLKVKSIVVMQKTMLDIDAPVIFTISWC